MQRRFLNSFPALFAMACLAASAQSVAASPGKAAVKVKAAPAETEIVAREAAEDRGAKSNRRPVFKPAAPAERDRAREAQQAEWVNDHAAAEHAESARPPKK